jgi:toxin YhaV
VTAVPPSVVNGWTLLAHPLFLAQFEELVTKVAKLKAKGGDYHKKKATKRLAALVKLVWEVIPQDPTRDEYRQGGTLGDEYKHWFRAKFFQQYRLFFRYRRDAKIIVFAWVNDDDTLRAYDSPSDAYRVFRGMLDGGEPPNDWDALVAASEKAVLRRPG